MSEPEITPADREAAPAMSRVEVNHLEIMSRAWAREKAKEIAGVALIPRAEESMERFLAVWLGNCLVEFVRGYDTAMTERVLQLERLLEDKLNTMVGAPLLILAPKALREALEAAYQGSGEPK